MSSRFGRMECNYCHRSQHSVTRYCEHMKLAHGINVEWLDVIAMFDASQNPRPMKITKKKNAVTFHNQTRQKGSVTHGD